MSQWIRLRLGDVCTKIGSGATPRGGNKVYLEEGEVALIRSQNVYNDGFRREGLVFISQEHADELQNVEVQPNDVLLNITGDSVARCCQVPPDVLPARVNQHVAIIRPDPAKLEPRFLRYALISPQMQAQLLSWARSGGTRNALTKGMIEALEIDAPSEVREQRAIAHILGTLDDKIELLRRMSETLEETARAIFKAWFVDFVPVRAKMEGRWKRGQSLPGLPAHLYDLFPDRLMPSELGEIPEGWEVVSLKDHFDAMKGLSYKGEYLGDRGLPLHNLNSIYEGGGYKHEGIKFYVGPYSERHLVRPGDVIVANTEQGHERLLIGYAAIIPKSFGDYGVFSHHLYRLRPRESSHLTAHFLYYLLNSSKMHGIISGYANGTTVNMLPFDGVQKPKFVCPPSTLLNEFEALASKIRLRREEIVMESRTLAALRDALLPKLVRGEIRVKGFTILK